MIDDGHIARINRRGEVGRELAQEQLADDQEPHRPSAGGDDFPHIVEARVAQHAVVGPADEKRDKIG